MRSGDWAWCALGVGVVAYEAVAPRGELLSEAVDRARTTRPWLTNAAVVYVALHLLRRWPRRLDPLTQIAGWVRR